MYLIYNNCWHVPYTPANGEQMKYKVFALTVLVTLLLAACGTSATPVATSAPATQPPAVATQPPGAVSGNTVEVKIAGFSFDPATITIKNGTTIKWTNMDSAAHTVAADDNSWTSVRLKQSDTYTHTFDQAGTYPYHCSLHSSMQATVIVQP
jgi:plastocyanin